MRPVLANEKRLVLIGAKLPGYRGPIMPQEPDPPKPAQKPERPKQLTLFGKAKQLTLFGSD